MDSINSDQFHHKCRTVLRLFKQWQRRFRPIANISSDTVKSLSLPNDELFTFLVPQMTKDVYYSLFVHRLLDIGIASGGNLYLILEATFTMVFTPSPSGWSKGIDLALDSNESTNLVVRFANEMVNKFGCVSAGKGRRRQVSHPRDMSLNNMYASLKNLHHLVDEANESNDTARLVKRFAKSPQDGGVSMAGPLIAQEIIHVLTKIGVIRNRTHAENVIVAKGTRTSKRLTGLGIRTEQDRIVLLKYLSCELGCSPHAAENGLCEALRWRYGSRRFFDTVGKNQKIYTTAADGTLEAFSKAGIQVPAHVPEWQTELAEDAPWKGARWWCDSFDLADIEGHVFLTNN